MLAVVDDHSLRYERLLIVCDLRLSLAFNYLSSDYLPVMILLIIVFLIVWMFISVEPPV